uniref:Uncharacterized protein n=1 Tax=Tanacetum cinerariifolium TaxID=118510 RepID=A0A699JI91_TANCI|nr:hypothetical protein [Tanacetum cinerariifolium]GFA39826.1 hypothetical protein [Tanacetum cinerariifolium]
MFQQGEDPIECINKAMAFLSIVASSFPPSNNQLRTSSNPRNQATVQDARVIVQQVQGRQNQSYAGEGHMARQCTQPKRLRNAAWFKEKLMLAEAQEAVQILDEKQLAFLVDPDCDDLSSAKAVLMVNLSSYDPKVLSKDNLRENQNAPTFNQLFELNELKALSQEKDTVIRKLKDRIKSLSGKDSLENVKKDIDEIETINIELEHSVAKLLLENENLKKEREHWKSIYKDQFDSIRKTRVQSKEQCDSLIAQINAKSVENSDLNAQLQEKIFANASLKNELKKLKGQIIVDTTFLKPNATIALGMFKLDC